MESCGDEGHCVHVAVVWSVVSPPLVQLNPKLTNSVQAPQWPHHSSLPLQTRETAVAFWLVALLSRGFLYNAPKLCGLCLGILIARPVSEWEHSQALETKDLFIAEWLRIKVCPLHLAEV